MIPFRRRYLAPILATVLAAVVTTSSAVAARTNTIDTSLGPLAISRVADGFDEPWSLAFLPDGRFLVTERAGKLSIFSPDGTRRGDITGLPKVWQEGQGGLLDVMVPRDFASSRRLWLTYAQSENGETGATAVGYGRLSDDATTLIDFRPVFTGPATQGGRHFGARLVEAPDGSVFVTFGERGLGMPAQDASLAVGKTIHLGPDGSPLAARPDWLSGVYSIGHRNPQGAALDGTGALWVVEHGAQGGDELNRIDAGKNYGWPVITYGRDYDDSPIGVGTAKAGMEQPVHYWDPSIAPSGLMVYTGAMFPEWQGDVFVGSLKFDLISRLDPDAGYAEETLQNADTGRVRDIRQAPDGAIWFLSVYEGAAFRIAR